MRELLLYIAASADGYIADGTGSVGWLDMVEADFSGEFCYDRLLTEVDTVVMGYNTYHQVVTQLSPGVWPYQGLECYVLTHRKLVDTTEVRFVDLPLATLLAQLNQRPGRSIWLCGGSQLIRQAVERDLIDEYRIATLPLFLGDGIRLFAPAGVRVPLRLCSVRAEQGAVLTVYRRRE